MLINTSKNYVRLNRFLSSLELNKNEYYDMQSDSTNVLKVTENGMVFKFYENCLAFINTKNNLLYLTEMFAYKDFFKVLKHTNFRVYRREDAYMENKIVSQKESIIDKNNVAKFIHSKNFGYEDIKVSFWIKRVN